MAKLVKRNFKKFSGKVYDLTVDGTHSYNIEGIPVHNSSGSVTSFLMGITDLDPIRFGLIFERFINPSRLDLPDADIDFMSTRRHEVINYITQRFGEKRVAGISNYTTMVTAGSIRDCGRVYEIPQHDLSVTKLIPKEHGKSFSLASSLEVLPELQNFVERYPDIWRHALGLEGCMRSLGRHAAGVVIAGEDIEGSGRAVIERRQGAATVNWDKTTVEDWGLVKIDVLGLSTLDVLRLTLENIKASKGEIIELTSIPIDDLDTMRAFGKGDTDSVFQFECLSGETMVDGMSLKDRFDKQTIGDEIRCLNEIRTTLEYGKIGKVVHSGKKMLYKLTLKDGKTILTTEEHRFYRDGRWVKLKDMQRGDKIAVVKNK